MIQNDCHLLQLRPFTKIVCWLGQLATFVALSADLLLKPLCLVVPFTVKWQLYKGVVFSRASTLKIACFMTLFVRISYTGMCWPQLIISGFLGEQ